MLVCFKGFLNEDAKYKLNKVVELKIKSREITYKKLYKKVDKKQQNIWFSKF